MNRPPVPRDLFDPYEWQRYPDGSLCQYNVDLLYHENDCMQEALTVQYQQDYWHMPDPTEFPVCKVMKTVNGKVVFEETKSRWLDGWHCEDKTK